MLVSRRGFLATCRNSASILGLGALELSSLESLMANPSAPTVLWLQGASCSGCSVSLLNYVSATAPINAAEVLISSVNLAYHPTLMGASGDLATSVVTAAMSKGGYILVVEGGVPTAFNGMAAIAWRKNGADVTFKQAVTELAAKASKIISVGACASYGGVPASGSNPAGIRSVKAVTLKNTINIPGCPPHPNWMVWGIVNAIKNTIGSLDSSGRPTALFGKSLHENCPRKERDEAKTYGRDNLCLEELGCRGPETKAPCYAMKWNNAQNWCIDANAQCIGCVNPTFPGTKPLRAGDDD